jgi:hypothetical protein
MVGQKRSHSKATDGYTDNNKSFKKEKKQDFSSDQHVPQVDKTSAEKRREQKEIKLQRKQSKPNFELIQQAKKLWEVLREKPEKGAEAAEKRKQQTAEMMSLVQGKIMDVRFSKRLHFHSSRLLIASSISSYSSMIAAALFRLASRWDPLSKETKSLKNCAVNPFLSFR